MEVRFYKDSNIVTSLVVVEWLTDVSISQHFQTLTTEGNKSHTRATRVNLLGSFVGCSVWLLFFEGMSRGPSYSPCAIKLAPSANTTRAGSETTLARMQRKHSLLHRLSLMYIIKDLSPPLLPGPKATIVFVVVIDIVFHPYSTKQSDHDSDANVEVERVF